MLLGAFLKNLSAIIPCDTGAKIGSFEGWQERIALVSSKGLAHIAPNVAERWFSQGFSQKDKATFHGYLNMLSRSHPEGYLGTCAALRDADLRDADLREAVQHIQLPALILCGEEDSSTPPSLSQELQKLIAHAELKLIPKTGHLPCIEKPEEMATYIHDFVSRLG
ncbi:MAG: alpha/beta fold hydrolase [Deinococcales bacterium]